MLIIVPSSETKQAPPKRGKPVALDALSFPELSPMRERVLDALIATSASPDALARLQVGPSFLDEADRNTRLRLLPARPVLEVYTGTLHGGLDAATLSAGAKRRASTRLVVASALWGLLRPSDKIPPYRMNICARLVGIDHLEPAWREVLPDVLAQAAGKRGVILDTRAASYQALGMPAGLSERTVTLHADASAGGRVGNVFTKRVRGEAARFLLESGEDPRTPTELARLLSERWPVRLEEPARVGRPWSLTVSLSV